MKVLIFTSLYPNNIWPNHGVFVKERMTRFAAIDGCQVRVVAPVPYFPPIKVSSRWKFSQVEKYEIRDGLEVHHPRYFMTPKVGMSLYGRFIFLSVLASVKRLQKNFDFDLIDAHFVYPDGLAAILLGRYFNKPVVVSARGSDINQYAAMPAIRPLLRHVMQNADYNIAVCQALQDEMVNVGAQASRVQVIPNGVDAEKFFPVDKQKARQALGLSEEKIILSVGQLIPRKGHDILIRAFERLIKTSEYSDAKLLIIGEGESKNELLSLIKRLSLEDKVFVLGGKPHEDLNLYYNAADLFCLASSREGWPNVVMESLACGTPVVATRVWGAPEILTSERLGLLVERSAPDFTAKMQIALTKAWDSKFIVEHMKMQTWEKAAQSVKELFERVIREEKASESIISS